MVKIVVILSFQRSGTCMLCTILNGFHNVTSYTEIYAKFFPYMDLAKKKINCISNKQFAQLILTDNYDAIHKTNNKHPEILLQTLKEICETEYLFFKLFPGKWHQKMSKILF